ncbi:type II toxin-antitoxin system antitoxin DNA ADP-ribosyl glycohydrolase DarG [Xenorhabdus kozodoii]|uniref:Appr-1-p processing protein n=1 Tax=Xenorhabdus kozodoii TaxID=351676 RepID=A0A2D0LFS4_9GAMM|nr:macro domain-containing protein [Xenorhabdus kozodoii]PHM74556.1 Appr-1-p processing protein [Xenorhabdus kozodoii]
MMHYTKGNLLDSDVEALVNTVNTVGVMGKGIALMFKERFPLNMALYRKACQSGAVNTGKIFVTETGELVGPRWIVNFPTKQHWRFPSKMEWIIEGLNDLKKWIVENNVRSIAIPPLGAGNGGLNWDDVKQEIEVALSPLTGVNIYIYEPIANYHNVSKKRELRH